MSTFFMFGQYSAEAVKGIGAERTEQAVNIIKEAGGEMKSMHALLGEYDLIFVADLPGMKEAMKASVALTKLTDISFVTVEAIPVADFDQMIAG